MKFLCLMVAALLPTPAAAQDRPPVSDSMSLAEIEAALRAFPPSESAWPERRQIAASLDRLIHLQVRDAMTDEERASLGPLRDFYRRRVDEGLDRLEKATVTQGVRAFKFYSSSVILKSAEGVVAVDFAQGPVNNGGEPEARDNRRTGFYWTPEQRDRLARLVDVSIITHRHHDHADYSLSKRLLDRGKTVVGPAQLKELWKDLGDRLTVPEYGKPQKIGPIEMFTLFGMQYARNRKDEQGITTAFPDPEKPGNDSETIAYLFRVGGLVFIQAGENHVPAGEWLRKGVDAGFSPDVRMSTGQFQGARSMDAVLKTLPRCLTLPVHEYEMMHGGGGNRTAPLFKDENRGRALPLFWGENAPIAREQIDQIRR